MKIILQKENEYILRFDKGEELIQTFKDFCQREKIEAGVFWGLGSAGDTELAYYNLPKKEYVNRKITGISEINSLNGSVATMKDNLIIHTHIILSDDRMNTFGGHINSLIVGATLEIYLIKIEGKIERQYSEEIGLNLFK